MTLNEVVKCACGQSIGTSMLGSPQRFYLWYLARYAPVVSKATSVLNTLPLTWSRRFATIAMLYFFAAHERAMID